MQSKLHFLIQAAPLMLVLFIDSIGLGLVIPLLNGLIVNPQSGFLSGNFDTPFMRNLIYGAILGIFMLSWFFGAAILGDLSDKIGRKKSLLICLFGAFLSYFVSAISISLHSLSLLFLGRIIGGLTSGSQPIAQAAIIDISYPEQKARNMSYMYLALSLGFILGPLLGGILSDSKLVSWFTFATPFYFSAILAFINIVLLWRLFNETFVVNYQKISIKLSSAIALFISAYKHDKVRNMSIIYTVFIFGWSSFYSFAAVFLVKNYGFTPTMISLYMGVMGVGFCIGNAFLVEWLSNYFSNLKVFNYASVAAAIASLLTVIIPFPIAAWILVIFVAAFIAATGPAVMSLFSDEVGPESQGWVMGIIGSIMALVWAINGVVVGAMASWSPALPLYIAAVCMVAAAVLSSYLSKHK